MCNCGCQQRAKQQDTPKADQKNYICYQCNTFKEAPAGSPAPECCGKKMEEMD